MTGGLPGGAAGVAGSSEGAELDKRMDEERTEYDRWID